MVLLVAACTHAPPSADAEVELPIAGTSTPEARRARESAMNSEWQNRPLSQLVNAKGQPMLVLEIPGGGNPPGFVVVFGVDRATGCVDAFAVSHDSAPRVRIYHCR